MTTTSRASKSEARQAKVAARRAAAARADRQRRIVVAAVAATAVIILGVVGALAFGGSGGTSTAGGTYRATREAFVLPGLLDEKAAVSLEAHKGTPVVVNFFASWCVYCNEELPGFVQVATATRGRVAFIGVDTGDPGDGAAMARRFDLAGAGFSLARDIGTAPPSDLWQSFGAQGLPVTAFYDATGTLVDFSGGMLTQAELQQRLATDFGVDATAPDAAGLAAPVIPLIPRGAYELLARSQGGGTPFVPLDLRPGADFAAGHLPGARSFRATPADVASVAAGLDRATSYVVYDADGGGATAVADALHAAGFLHVYVIEGGYAAWTAQGLPTTP